MNSRNQPLVSVIVPVYGVERYLNRCVESIVKQTYRDLEIILVDDGSRDDCPRMCDEWALKDTRIKVIHKPNGGLASARNAGLDVMTGDYVTFVDSDDWVEPNYVSCLHQWMAEHQADVTMCATEIDYDDGTVYMEPCNTPEGSHSGKEALHRFLYHQGFVGAVWGRMFDASLFAGERGIRFHEGLNNEDYYVHVQVFPRISSMYVQHEHLYHYCRRAGSICTTTDISERTYDEERIADLCVEFLHSIGYSDSAAMDYFRMQGRADVLFALFQRHADARTLRTYGKRIRTFIRPVLRNASVSVARKMRLFALVNCPVAYYRLQRCAGKV